MGRREEEEGEIGRGGEEKEIRRGRKRRRSKRRTMNNKYPRFVSSTNSTDPGKKTKTKPKKKRNQ